MPLERLHAAIFAQCRNDLIEWALQMRGMHGIEHRADVVAEKFSWGIFIMPNSVWQLEVFWPSSSER